MPPLPPIPPGAIPASAIGAAGKGASAAKTGANYLNDSDRAKMGKAADGISQSFQNIKQELPDPAKVQQAVGDWAGRWDGKK